LKLGIGFRDGILPDTDTGYRIVSPIPIRYPIPDTGYRYQIPDTGYRYRIVGPILSDTGYRIPDKFPIVEPDKK